MGCNQIGAADDLGLRRLEGSSLNSNPGSAKYRTGARAARPEKKLLHLGPIDNVFKPQELRGLCSGLHLRVQASFQERGFLWQKKPALSGLSVDGEHCPYRIS